VSGSVATWQNLAEMDLEFARSRRRVRTRRKAPRERNPLVSRGIRAAVVALALLTVLGASTKLDRSSAGPAAPEAAARAVRGASCPVPERFRASFARAAARTGVPLSLLVATAYEESQMNPSARSGTGAKGLLQLMPATARELRLDGDDPAANVLAGAMYLRRMIDRFGSVDLALAAYNAGPTAVEHVGRAPTDETLRYVKNVEARALLLPC
jgi:soluble lytic murein transglycosylase-like protein